MAKFCKYCGKKLINNEKCDCQTKIEKKKQNPEFKKAKETITKEVSDSSKKYAFKIWEICNNIFKNPDKTKNEFIKAEDFNLTCVILILTSFLLGISTVSFLKGIIVGGYDYPFSISQNALHQIWNISYFKVLLCVSFGVFISYFLLSIILNLGFEKISQTKLSVKKALSGIAICSIEPTIYCVIGAFLTIISYKLAILLIIFAILLYLINLFQCFYECCDKLSIHYNQIFTILLLIFGFLAIYLIPKLFL